MFLKEVKIPEDVKVSINGEIKVVGPNGEIRKRFELVEVKIEKDENKIKIFSESENRKIKAKVGTIAAHIRNMINGVKKGYTYKLKVVYSHFPISVKVEGDKVLILNFLGEKIPRIAKIVGNTKVKIEKDEIIVSGIDIDEVSQTASNIELACRIKRKDRKIFQDGIWITGRER
ncbi:MAG: 50S ribosomal protein L6 [Candidatus Aenigmatarchaeota archaeon]